MLVIVALLAQFGMPGAGNPWWPSVQAPPAQYNHVYRGHLIVKEMESGAMHAICGYGVACTRGNIDGICIVYINRMYRDTVRPAIMQHEIAHCNGWRHG